MEHVASIYDRWGQPVAWLHGEVVYDLQGRMLASVHARHLLISRSGLTLGELDRGVFRDLEGAAVAFVAGALGPPVLPVPHVAPVAPPYEIVPSCNICSISLKVLSSSGET
jgi:hypothetical protein